MWKMQDYGIASLQERLGVTNVCFQAALLYTSSKGEEEYEEEKVIGSPQAIVAFACTHCVCRRQISCHSYSHR